MRILSAALTRFIFLSGLLISASSAADAQQLPIKTYTTADGLARDAINCIVTDSRGFLWFGTFEGLSRFDGYRFTNYTTTDGLPHRSIRGVLETRNGVFWIATGDGVARLNPRGSSPKRTGASSAVEPLFTVYRPGEDENVRSIRALFEDHTGAIWCGTNRGLYRLEQTGDEVQFQFVDLGMPSETVDDRLIETILEDRQGAMWVGTRGSGLYRRRPDGRTERYTKDHGLVGNRIQAILEDRNGRLWIATTEGLCLMVAEPSPNQQVVASTYTTKEGLPSNWINALFQTRDGRLWVGTNSGLSEQVFTVDQDDHKFRSYTIAHGLSHDEINALGEDGDGNLWIGTTYGGAMKLARSGFVTYRGEADGLGGLYSAVAIFQTRAGELCLAEKQIIRRFDGRRFIAITPSFPKTITYFGWGWYQLTLQDRADEWWIPTGQGLCRFPKVSRIEDLAHTRPKAIYTIRDGLVSDDIFRIFEDSRGDIWISSFSLVRSGVTRWERATETFHTYADADGLPPPPWTSQAFGEDASGNVWFGTSVGLARYSAGRLTLFTTGDGVPAGITQAIYSDRGGRLWIATSDGGIARIDEPSAERPRFITYTTADGLSSSQTFCITEDLRGNIYIGTGRGVDRLNPETGKIRHYTTADGLAGSQAGVALRDLDGALWFSAAQGLSRLIPEPDPLPLRPPIFISGVRIAGESYPISELCETDVPKIEFGPGANQIQIDFVGLSFATGEALRYQYKLEGADADWSAITDQRSINYASLSPGTYRFIVRAVNADGVLSETPAQVAFRILPPIWQRWWFLALATLFIVLAAYAAYRYRVRRLIELERVRTRIAADLHDDIGASLSRMAILSEVVKRQIADSAQQSVPLLSDIAESARGLVGSMRDIVWAIDPRRDDLSSVVFRIRQFAADVLEGKGIRWDFHTPSDLEKIKLGPDHRRHVFLFFKEAVNNVARHSASSAVWMSIAVEHNQLIGEVRDDGRGFAAEQVSADGGGGHGLENMQRRVGQLGGALNIRSSPGQGTHLRLRIPLKRP